MPGRRARASLSVPKQTPGTVERCDQLACLGVYERRRDNSLVSDALSCGRALLVRLQALRALCDTVHVPF